MASVKREQIIQEAEKLAARGKLDAAIKEYRRAVDQVPGDTNTLNRLGDLLVRVERIPEAIEVYQRIAEHFADDGFFLKSIAIYKKVNRLDPRRTETYERLADLYFKQGLVVEGRQQLLTLADWFLRSKQAQEAVRVYRRLVELEPSNLQARAKVVDLSVQLGDVATVGTEIDALGRSLLSRGMLDEAVKLYHRALDLGPEKADFVAPCIDALVAGGRQAQAAELAKKALASTKGGVEVQRAAARALAENGEADEARRLLEDLLNRAGDRTDILQIYGDVIIRMGDAAEAKEKLLPAIDRLLKARDVARAATLVKRLVSSSPGDIEVLERAFQIYEQMDDADMVVNIETALADAYFRSGRQAESIPLYRRLAVAVPGNPLFAQRLTELGVAVPSAPPAAAPTPPARTAAQVPDADAEVEFVDVEFAPASAPDAAPGPALPMPARDAGSTEPSMSPTNAEELYTEAVVFAKYGLTDKAVAHLRRLVALDPKHERGRGLLASLGGGELVEVERPPAAPAEASPEPPVPAAAPEAPLRPPAPPLEAADLGGARDAFTAFAHPALPPARKSPATPAGFGATLDLSLPVPGLDLSVLGAPAVAASPRAEAPLPSFDDVLVVPPRPHLAREGRRPPTGPVRLNDLEAMLGLREPSPSRGTAAPAPAAAVAMPAPPADEGAEPVKIPLGATELVEALDAEVELVEVPGVLAGPGDEQLRELDFLIQQGLLDDAAKLLTKVRDSYPDSPEVVARQAMLKARGWDEERRETTAATAAELFSEEEQFFDLAAELEKELADEEMVAEATGSGKASDVSIEELFKEFQRGVAEQVQVEDFDTHFNLGLAYREMGLLDEAIGEFQLSAKSPEYLVESASMIGACYLEKGLPEQAAEWYQRALTATGLPPEAELGLRYELGRAHESAGNTAAALASFSEVLAINPAFRDVVDRVSKLRSN
jgi:pilus assembly protein FimV